MNSLTLVAALPLALAALTVTGTAQDDLSTWQVEVYGNPTRPPVWDLTTNLAYQTKDSDVAGFAYGGEDLGSMITNVDLTGFHINGFTEDMIGLALGVNAGTTSDTNADYLLLRWPGASEFNANDPTCTVGGPATMGLGLYRVSGVPTLDEFWIGNDQNVVCSPAGQGLELLAMANTLGSTGWTPNATNDVQIELGPCSLRISVNGTEEFLVAGDFASIATGKLGLFCFSQRVLASNVTYSPLPTPGLIETLGAGTMGADRIPTIETSGCPVLGLDFQFDIRNSSDSATAAGLLAIGRDPASVPLAQFSATLLVLPILVVPTNAVAGGVDTRIFTLSGAPPVGMDFHAQAAWFDAAGPGGIAMTPSVRALVGN